MAYIRSRRLKKDEALKEYREYLLNPKYFTSGILISATSWGGAGPVALVTEQDKACPYRDRAASGPVPMVSEQGRFLVHNSQKVVMQIQQVIRKARIALEARSLNNFKAEVDRYLTKKGVKVYQGKIPRMYSLPSLLTGLEMWFESHLCWRPSVIWAQTTAEPLLPWGKMVTEKPHVKVYGGQSGISKFDDDTKIGSVENSECDIEPLQQGIDRLTESAEFNTDKCEVMQFGRMCRDGMDMAGRMASFYAENDSMTRLQRAREKRNQNLRIFIWNVTTMDQNQATIDWNITIMGRSFSSTLNYLSANYDRILLEWRVQYALEICQYIYYPILAIVGVPVNLVTIVILSQGKCGLSKCVTHYLVGMAVADLLVVILDLILRHIPIVYREQFQFMESVPVCNIHAVLLYAAADCSVWFTVTFTFDRFVAICCQKMKIKYCTEKVAAAVLGTVAALSCLKNITWYFMLTDSYDLSRAPWFCWVTMDVAVSAVWGAIEFLHYLLSPGVAFVFILSLNAFTVRHILVASRARRRLQAHRNGESPRDPEMESRRKSLILVFAITGNFMLLWSTFMVYFIWYRMALMGYSSLIIPYFVQEIAFMLQLLSCCTNTCIYALTQSKFREQLKNLVKYHFTLIVKHIK
ncbi:uncharacterized protein [Heterodontus francisci]|uniref:uncharacterized protein n=1 Tax=Heterodontus francisci TaxID=7792 RepID=UPI00355BD158